MGKNNSNLLNTNNPYSIQNNIIPSYLYESERNISGDHHISVPSKEDNIHQVIDRGAIIGPMNTSQQTKSMWHNRGNQGYANSYSIQIPAEQHMNENHVNKNNSKKFKLRSCGKNMKNIWLTIKYTVLIGIVLGISIM